MSPEPAAPAPMRGREAWRRTLEVRERFLAAGDPDRLPSDACGVRREILLSWRRSLLSGVDAAATDLPRDEGAVPPGRFVRAARPVVDRLAEELAGTQAWAFLADRECRLIRYVVGDPALIPRLEARGAFPGARFGEDIVGTNGLGTAVEQHSPRWPTASGRGTSANSARSWPPRWSAPCPATSRSMTCPTATRAPAARTAGRI